jgi:hypothetical protein
LLDAVAEVLSFQGTDGGDYFFRRASDERAATLRGTGGLVSRGVVRDGVEDEGLLGYYRDKVIVPQRRSKEGRE